MKYLVFSHFTTIVKLWQVEQVPMYIDIQCLRCDPLSVLFWPLFLCHLSLQAMGPAGLYIHYIANSVRIVLLVLRVS